MTTTEARNPPIDKKPCEVSPGTGIQLKLWVSLDLEKGVRNRFPPSRYPLVSRPPENGS
jgi:hypothetical protein